MKRVKIILLASTLMLVSPVPAKFKLDKLDCAEGEITVSNGDGTYSCAPINPELINIKFNNLARLMAAGAGAYVFVTSEAYTGNLGGVEGAHLICQSTADAAGLPGKFKAWIADENNWPLREAGGGFQRALWRYVLPSGIYYPDPSAVADSFFDLVLYDFPGNPPEWDGPDHPINRTEDGMNLEEVIAGEILVWTGVTFLGERVGGSPEEVNCDEWTSDRSDHFGVVGDATNSGGPPWTDMGLRLQCNEPRRLYCFGN